MGLLEKVNSRVKLLDITLDDISKLSNLDYKIVSRFFNGKSIDIEKVKKITNILGLDFKGNEVVDITTLKDKRAEQRALYIVSLVQDTSSLEMQGLEDKDIKVLLKETKEQFLTGDYKHSLWKT